APLYAWGQGIRFVSVAAGNVHTCGVTTDGGVKCWGHNANGELGDATYEDRSKPVDVVGLTNAVAVAAGLNHTCALTSFGGVKSWGANHRGQIGDPTAFERVVPVDVQGLSSGVTAIAAGGLTTCALTNAGAVKCWGANSSGQVGDGTNGNGYSPTDVSGLGSG